MKVPAKGTPLRQRMIEDMGIRNLSPATQYNYINCVAKYALHFGKSPAVLGPEHIRGYQVHLTQVKRVSWSVFNTAVCALRFLYRITLQKDWAVEHIPYPKKPKRLPEVLSLDASVTVPYGSWDNALQTKEWTPLEPGVVDNKYYAPGVGEVRSLAVEGGSEEMQLVSITHT